MDLGLSGRRVLVTGGSLGIGFAVARGFLAEGCDVTIAARDKARLAARGREARARRAGADRGTARSTCRSAARPRRWPRRTAMPTSSINNAGAIPTGDIFEIDEARWRAAWDLKVFGYVNLTRAMYGRMRGQPPKVIVNVIGTGAERPQWRYVCGNAANIALNGLTKSLGGRSLDDGIRVVGVNPGAVDTERWRSIHQARAKKLLGDASRWQEVLLPDRPLGRAATPEEIADVIVFLASDRAGWICGEVVNVDGGALFRENSF